MFEDVHGFQPRSPDREIVVCFFRAFVQEHIKAKMMLGPANHGFAKKKSSKSPFVHFRFFSNVQSYHMYINFFLNNHEKNPSLKYSTKRSLEVQNNRYHF